MVFWNHVVSHLVFMFSEDFSINPSFHLKNLIIYPFLTVNLLAHWLALMESILLHAALNYLRSIIS